MKTSEAAVYREPQAKELVNMVQSIPTYNIDHDDVQVRNGNIAWRHITSEYTDVVEDILDTLAPEGPYAYTVQPGPTEPGVIPHQTVVSTFEQIRGAYENLHRYIAVRDMHSPVEIRGEWYTFMFGIGTALMRDTGEEILAPTAVLFPTMGQRGITGELFWTRCRFPRPDSDASALDLTLATLASHDRWLSLVRSGDVAGMLAMSDPNVQTAVFDLVSGSGLLAEMHSAAELEGYLERFAERFEVQEVEIIHRYVDEWFAFSELRWVVRDRREDGAAPTRTFRTAEILEIDSDGLIVGRIGHATQPA